MAIATSWITGAHGFIGKHLAKSLSNSGQTVIGIGHGLWPIEESKQWGISDWLNGDIKPSNLHLLKDKYGEPDVIYHLAGGSSVGASLVSPREDFFRTVATTSELLDWVRSHTPNTRLVAVSSAAVYGAGHTGMILESAKPLPYSPYGYHKLMMEDLFRSYASNYGLKVVIARLFSIYGTGLRKQLLWDLCSKLNEIPDTVTLGGNGAELRDWANVVDVAKALTLISNQASSLAPTINVGTGKGTSVTEIGRLVMKHWGMTNTASKLKFTGKARAGDPSSLISDNTILTKLGFEWSISLDKGINAYAKWFQSLRKYQSD